MAEFKDFNFKLAVVETLMYIDGTLTPVFRIDELLRAKGASDVYRYVYDKGLAYTVLDESRAYFEALEISDELLASVEELVIDGGNQVNHECAPIWDGEDGLFDVRSLDDLDLLPNLKRVLGEDMIDVPDMMERFAARGITVD
ncbi:hypothetical protein CP967_17715 [Streptomyces nitrosporeus]|uniref:DUF6892 domain-containing protein n=1 Tax=Streptomyces nitrosporeus TaxID=28894 RepID=A0A5J6FAP5_9ACTN|nr:hypothetical protein [Streptomyces nitrosporeus]QEU73589.1 hypothetical protein CP967_17715 [Streptomyces nitrosporeus]GGZ12842.1 hypothetical protein GCM10010327_49870 [Streptomyces nitrosporeus]